MDMVFGNISRLPGAIFIRLGELGCRGDRAGGLALRLRWKISPAWIVLGGGIARLLLAAVRRRW